MVSFSGAALTFTLGVMKARVLAALKTFLVVWGALSLVAIIALAVAIFLPSGRGGASPVGTSAVQDVRFVLNWCGLGDSRIDKVIHSHVSARSMGGDYLDAYAIRISRVEIAELAAPSEKTPDRWYRGDQLPPIVSDAVAFVGMWAGNDEIPWFPKESELRSGDVYVFPWAIHTHGVQPAAVELIFVRPADKMIFYFGGKT